MKSLAFKIAVAAVLLAVIAMPAAAQKRDVTNPWSVGPGYVPKEVVREEATAAMPVVCAVVGLAGTCVVGFKKPKRTHLD